MPPGADIRHIGATAIDGCLTKGDLDIVVRVEKTDFEFVRDRLAARFERNGGSPYTDEFASFTDEARVPHLGVQLTVKGGELDVFHVFTDALNADHDLVERYNDLKRKFCGASMDLYRREKATFIEAVLQNPHVGRCGDRIVSSRHVGRNDASHSRNHFAAGRRRAENHAP